MGLWTGTEISDVVIYCENVFVFDMFGSIQRVHV